MGRLVSDVTAVPQAPTWPVALGVRAMPNPFNPRVRVEFELAVASVVDVRILDPRGRELRRMARGRLPAGPHHVDWDGLDRGGEPVASGVVFLEVTAGAMRGVAKAVLVR